MFLFITQINKAILLLLEIFTKIFGIYLHMLNQWELYNIIAQGPLGGR
jgi:hypothetical protein